MHTHTHAHTVLGIKFRAFAQAAYLAGISVFFEMLYAPAELAELAKLASWHQLPR